MATEKKPKLGIDFRMRGIPAICCMIGIQAFVLLAVSSGFLGGGPGPVEKGKYFLESHGDLTEVPPHVYNAMRIIEKAAIIGWIIAAGSIFLAFSVYGQKAPWYLRSNDYGLAIIIMVACDAAFIIIADLLGHPWP